jgi:ABC-type phosphate/phosphonate transport system substrate-binding protein
MKTMQKILALAAMWVISGAVGAAETYVLTSAPKGTQQTESALLEPVAALLTQAVGKPVVYEYSENWLAYQKRMLEGRYDIIFDGPHFVGWRLAAFDHEPIVKLPGRHVFVVVTRQDNAQIKRIEDLAGRGVCAHAPPNLGTLILQSLFPNPARQPRIVETKGWDGAYRGLAQGKCVATILPEKNLAKFDNGPEKTTRLVYSHRVLPNQAMTAGPRVDERTRNLIETALLSEAGRKVLAKVAEAYGSQEFVRAHREEFTWLAPLLQDERGYGEILAARKSQGTGTMLTGVAPPAGKTVKVKYEK